LELRSSTNQGAINSLLLLQIFALLIGGRLGAYFGEVRDREHIFSLFDLLNLHFQIT